MKRLALGIFILLTATTFAAENQASPVITVESQPQNGAASLYVYCEVKNAELWLDKLNRGKTPVELTGLTAGQHSLVLKAKGYSDLVLTLTLMPDTKTSISTSLKQLTGFLDIRVRPQNAEILVDDNSYSEGFLELALGIHEIRVRAFGYKDLVKRVLISENLVYSMDVELLPAAFEAKGFYQSTSRMNPRNSGMKGILAISFSVTAPGSGVFIVRDYSGKQLESIELPGFTTWEQSVRWDGRDKDGQPLADGSYHFELQLWPAPGQESLKDSYNYESQVELDSSLVIIPAGAYGAMFGSEYSPDGFAANDTNIRVGMSAFAKGSISEPAVRMGELRLGIALSFPPMLDLGAGFETDTKNGAGRLGLRLSLPMTGILGLSGLLEGRIANPSLYDPAWIRAGAVAGLGKSYANLVLSPHIGGYWEDAFKIRAGIGAALNIGSYEFGAAVSAMAMSGNLADGFDLELPLKTALELRYVPQKFIMAFSLLFGLDLDPEPAGWMAGLSVFVNL